MTSSSATSLPSASLNYRRRGVMLLLASPPGGGKTTISREIMARDPETTVSISATTRAMRPGEEDGVHYHFVTEPRFQEIVAAGDMLEHAFVYNNYHYGTPRAPVEKALTEGRDILFDIDWQGTRSLKQTMPQDVVTVFILPPSWETLCDRLHGRAQDSEEEITRRLSKARDEISHYGEFDYVVTNKNLEESIQKVWGILKAERHKRHRQPDLDAFVATLKP